MPGRRRKFIDPRHEPTTSFVLVHRSQKDPLAADETAPQRVLQQVVLDEDATRKKEEERDFGVFFDDDYNYLQHLKDRTAVEHDWEEADRFVIDRKKEQQIVKPKPQGAAKSALNLPSSVFASEFEEKVGLLNKAATQSGPRVDWDPDIGETLDDAYNHEIIVNVGQDDKDDGEDHDDLDDLLAEAMLQPDGDGSDQVEESDEEYSSGEENDDVPSLEGGFSFTEEETKTKFTSYSMSSSVVTRNEQLTILDDRFERFFDEYMDENTGGLEMDDIEGSRQESDVVMDQLVEQFEANRASERQPLPKSDLSGRFEEREEETKAQLELLQVEVPKEKWDCESIISTYSNLYHHPKLISERPQKITISRNGMPKDVLGKGLTVSALKQLDRSNAVSNDETCTLASRVSELSVRNKHETLDEKKARKKALQEYRRERRVEKKANAQAFKEEKEKQVKEQINLKNQQGKRLV